MADPVPNVKCHYCGVNTVNFLEHVEKYHPLQAGHERAFAEGAAAAHKAWNIEAGRICAGSEFIADPKRVFDHIMDHTLPVERGLGKRAGEAAAAERIAELEAALRKIAGSGPACEGKGPDREGITGCLYTKQEQVLVDAQHRNACKRCIAQAALAQKGGA